MKTRELGSIDNDDPFKDLEPAKPLDLGDINKLLNTAQAPQAVPNSVEIVASEKNKVDLTANTSPDLGPEWIRQDLPSLGIPYIPLGIKEIFLRPLSIPLLSKIHAARINESFPILVDALNNCINIDIRLLTPEDFIFAMYWIRDNSYPTVPMRIPHKTMYGNEIEINVRRTNLKITELNMTIDEYRVWYDKGYCFPTVRDAELITRNEEDIDEEQSWMLETSQYIRPFKDGEEIDYKKYVSNKFDNLEKLGPSALIDINNFKKEIAHGIEQTIEVVDYKFEPNSAIEYMEKEVLRLKEELNGFPEIGYDDARGLILLTIRQIRNLENEIDLIKAAIDSGAQYTPKKEVVAVKISATHFFPEL